MDSAATEAQVIEYLRNNNDFFEKHTELLADIQLPHQSGQAISLVEKQVSVLRDRNMDMRHRLSKLLENAKENDKLFDKTKRLVLSMLSANSLSGALGSLILSFDQDFRIHYTRVILFDREACDNVPDQAKFIPLNDCRSTLGNIIKQNKAVCGQLSPQELSALFDSDAKHVGSAAVVPLTHGNTFGLLAIGNRDPQYYRTSMGTLFLGYIAEILNRTLPRFK